MDRLVDHQGRRLAFKALGWALRRLFCIKDNYFGGFTQFQTMEEYQARHDYDPGLVGDPVEEKYRPGRVSLANMAVADISLTHLRSKSR